eukprot:3117021-Pyramimonas_sp.AAC.1
MAKLVLQHEDRDRATHRDNNVVLELDSKAELKLSLDRAADPHDSEGKAAKAAAAERTRCTKGIRRGSAPTPCSE